MYFETVSSFFPAPASPHHPLPPCSSVHTYMQHWGFSLPFSKYVLFFVAGLQLFSQFIIAMWYFYFFVCMLKLVRKAAAEHAGANGLSQSYLQGRTKVLWSLACKKTDGSE